VAPSEEDSIIFCSASLWVRLRGFRINTESRSGIPSAAGAPGSGRIDHLCINCDGLAEFIDRLQANGVDFSERKAHNSKLYQLFMREPVNGIKVELNFDWREAAALGRVPEWTDAGINEKSAAEVMLPKEAPVKPSTF